MYNTDPMLSSLSSAGGASSPELLRRFLYLLGITGLENIRTTVGYSYS